MLKRHLGFCARAACAVYGVVCCGVLCGDCEFCACMHRRRRHAAAATAGQPARTACDGGNQPRDKHSPDQTRAKAGRVPECPDSGIELVSHSYKYSVFLQTNCRVSDRTTPGL